MEEERRKTGFAKILREMSIRKQEPKRKVFISFCHRDDDKVKLFLYRWTEREKIFIPKALGVSDEDDFINSDNPEYVIAQIRKRYIQDSTVTIVLLGSCTHGRRFVDWEIKASLRQGTDNLPNGLLGILLPNLSSVHLPERFVDNWNKEHKDCYARYKFSPTNGTELRTWIEDAFQSRKNRFKYIKNDKEIMKYNAKCKICNITH
ncbi:MAG: TIR domain-containing protein [Candidatus Firestonebacteria bacterium]